VTYTWTVPSDWTITSGQNTSSITVTTGSTAGNITVVPSNACGNGTSQTLAVTYTLPPIANAGIDQIIPNGSFTTLSGSASGGSGSYSWHWEPANLLVDPNIQNPTTLPLTNSVQFTLTVTDISYGCTGADQVLVTVSGGPLALEVIAEPDVVCASNPVQLMAIASGGTGSYTYSWASEPPGFSSDLQNPVAYPIVSTTYIVEVNDGDSTINGSVNVTVNPLPLVPNMPSGPDTVDVVYVSESQYTIIALEDVNYYIWDLAPTNAGFINGNDTIATVIWNNNYLGNATVKAKSVNSCGESAWSQAKQTFVDNTTGIVENFPCSLSLYPNPVNGNEIVISYCRALEKVEIIDNKGSILGTYYPRVNSIRIPVNFTSGIYLARIKIDNAIMTRIFIVN
jgi:hypothetical protein